MIILVEGPDCTGKTTLCNCFVKKRNFNYIHLSRCNNVNNLYKELIKDLQKSSNQNIIIDRAVISNYIYQSVFSDSELLANSIRTEFLKLIDLIIICLPEDREKYLKMFNSNKNIRSEMYDKMDEIYDYFNSSFNLVFLKNKKTIRYDMLKISKNDIDKFIKENVLC